MVGPCTHRGTVTGDARQQLLKARLGANRCEERIDRKRSSVAPTGGVGAIEFVERQARLATDRVGGGITWERISARLTEFPSPAVARASITRADPGRRRRQTSCVCNTKSPEVCMSCRPPLPASPGFDAVARRAQFRDLVAVIVAASPEAIFRALRDVRLTDMKLAWLLGEVRYLPSRLAGRMPPVDASRPFLESLIASGTLVLRDDSPRELITGSAAQLHRLHQTPQRFVDREAFDAFNDPAFEKLFMSVRVIPTATAGEHWVVLESATQALSPLSERRFARYWRVIRPTGAFVSRQLLRAVRRRAEVSDSRRPRRERAAA